MVSVIIDTDMLIDDWIGILYLLQNSQIKVQGIAVTGTGGSYLSPGTKNALALLKIYGLDTQVPVVSGAKMPMLHSNVYPKSVRVDAADFSGITVPPSTASPSPLSLVDFYIDLLSKASSPLRILSIGGGSNLGELLISPKLTPDLRKKIDKIVIMGGAIYVGGNLADLTDTYDFNKVAEWNIFVDVKAMQTIFDSGIPIILVPLDACDKVQFDQSFIDDFAAKAKGAGVAVLLEMLKVYLQTVKPPYVYDPLTAVVLANLDNPDIKQLVTIEKLQLSIRQDMIVSGDPDFSGQVTVGKGSSIMTCLSANKEIFQKLYLSAFL